MPTEKCVIKASDSLDFLLKSISKHSNKGKESFVFSEKRKEGE